jgi:hypothetical protein
MDTSFQCSKTGKDEWLTPKSIIDALGEFDLDPCAPVIRPWNTARKHFTIEDNGLLQEWGGANRVFCNPPYGNQTALWLNKCALHGNCIVLIFARTETKMFFDYIWNKADAIFFFKGRLRFYHVTGEIGGTAGCGSCLVAYGHENALAIQESGLKGKLIWLIP